MSLFIRKSFKNSIIIKIGYVAIFLVLLILAYRILFFTSKVGAASWPESLNDWSQRKEFTVINTTGQELPSGTTYTVSINTQSLSGAGLMQSDCQDLRVFYQPNSSTTTQLAHTYAINADASDCSDSASTRISFPIQNTLSDGGSDSNYFIYYGNSSAADAYDIDANDIDTADNTFVCNFDATTTCKNESGDVSATASGPERYIGGKSAAWFDGATTSMSPGSDALLDNLTADDFTVEWWQYWVNEGDNNSQNVVGKDDGGAVGWRVYYNKGSERIHFAVNYDSTDVNYRTDNNVLTPYSWEHIAIVWDVSEARPYIYINGEETTYSSSVAGSGSLVDDGAAGFTIGSTEREANPFYSGLMDEFRLSEGKRYEGSFSLPTEPYNPDPQTIILYHFDEAGVDPRQTSSAIDSSKNGLHATLGAEEEPPTYVNSGNVLDHLSGETGYFASTAVAERSGLLIETDITNKITNPSFEFSTYDNDWTEGGNLTVNEETTEPFYAYGLASAEIDASGSGDNDFTITVDPDSTSRHTLSAYAYLGGGNTFNGNEIDNTIAQLVWEGSAQSSTVYEPVGGGWWRLSYSASTTDASNEYGISVLDGSTVYVDGFQLEQNYGPTTYADGTMGTGYAWTGTAHDSTSTRTATELEYSTVGNIDEDNGSLSLWYKPSSASSTYGSGGEPVLFQWLDGTSNYRLRYVTSSGIVRFRKRVSGLSNVADNSTALGENEWIHIVATWSSTNGIKVYVNNDTPATNSNTDNITLTTTTFDIGHNDSNEHANGTISKFQIFDEELSTTEITDLYLAGASTFTEKSTDVKFSDGVPPVIHYKLDERYGTTVNSSTEQNITGTISGATWLNGSECIGAGCLSFDGTDDSVTIEDDFAIRGEDGFSIGAWIKPNSDALSGTPRIIEKSDGTDDGYILSLSSGAPRLQVGNGSTLDTATSSVTLESSDWYHVMGTWDGTNARIYVDGIDTGSASATSITLNEDDLSIGGTSSNYFSGTIDEVKYFDYAKTSDEMKKEFSSPLGGTKGAAAAFGAPNPEKSLSENLVGWYKFDEESANTCTGGTNDACDSSGNGIDGAWIANATSSNASKFNKGITQDGSATSGINFGDVHDMGTSNFSVGLWINLDSLSSPDAPELVDKMLSNTTGYHIRVGYNDEIEFQIKGDGPDDIEVNSDNFVIDTGEWIHVLAVYDVENGHRVYINGEQSGNTVNGNAGDIDNSDSFLAGKGFNAFELDGRYDELRVYSRALGAPEAASLYKWSPKPVAHFSLDENSGTTINDISGSGLSGTLENSTWDAGVSGSAIGTITDGSTDSFIVPDNDILDFSDEDDFSFGGWLKYTSTENSVYPIFKGAQNTTTAGYSLKIQSSIEETECNYTDGNGSSRDIAGLSGDGTADGEWHHFMCVMDRDGSEVGTVGYHLFIDGTLVGSDTSPTENDGSGSTEDLEIGERNITQEMDGFVDDVKIYNYARSPSQIDLDMNFSQDLSTNAVLNLKFNEGYGDSTYDSSDFESTGNLGGVDSCPGGGDCPTWTNSGINGKALDFDGTDDIVSVPDIDAFSFGEDDFSLSAWVKTNSDCSSVEGSAEAIAGAYDDSRPTYALGCQGTTGYAFFTIADSASNFNDVYSTQAINDDEWHHLVAVKKGHSSAKSILYIDGKFAGESSDSFTGDFDFDQDFEVGHYANGYNFDGLIDEVKLFRGSLTDAQIKTDYNMGLIAIQGYLSTDSSGVADNSDERSYCVPGDASTCNAPVFEMKFDENTGTSSVYDTSGNENSGSMNGTMTESDWVPGKFGSALDFDGSDDYVSIPDDDTLDVGTGGMTISAWVKTTQSVGTTTSFIDKKIGGSSTAGYNLQLSNTDKLLFRIANGSSQSSVLSTTDINDGEWHHVAGRLVRSGGGDTIMAYVDGKKEAEVSVTAGWDLDSIYQIEIGRITTTSSFSYEGIVDNVLLYDYTRTPEQIAWDYNKGKPIAHYKFDECTGSTVFDASISANKEANGNDGTVTIGGSGTNTSVGECAGAATSSRANGATGKVNYALDFDGTDDYVDMGDPADGSLDVGNNNISLEAWIKTSSSTDQRIIAKKTNVAANAGYSLRINSSGEINVTFADGSSSHDNSTSGVDYADDQWHHVVATYVQGLESKIYVDGNLVDTGSSSFDGNMNSSNNLRIGSYSGGGEYFNGLIDEAKIYLYALSDEQVKSSYNNGAVSFK